eukprot:scaffold2908_cov257-Pinguiococcus_pyrenoidosus.AAC.18
MTIVHAAIAARKVPASFQVLATEIPARAHVDQRHDPGAGPHPHALLLLGARRLIFYVEPLHPPVCDDVILWRPRKVHDAVGTKTCRLPGHGIPCLSHGGQLKDVDDVLDGVIASLAVLDLHHVRQVLLRRRPLQRRGIAIWESK